MDKLNKKRRRRVIYRISGLGMYCGLLIGGVFYILDYKYTVIIVEWVELSLFGVGWLVKSKSISTLNDR
jgi:hypothetical protein